MYPHVKKLSLIGKGVQKRLPADKVNVESAEKRRDGGYDWAVLLLFHVMDQ